MKKDWKKTAVAFASSVPNRFARRPVHRGRNNGEIETPQPNLDEAQKRFNAQMGKVYPRIALCPEDHHRERTPSTR